MIGQASRHCGSCDYGRAPRQRAKAEGDTAIRSLLDAGRTPAELFDKPVLAAFMGGREVLPAREELVAAGHLGRKTGRGFYTYS